MNMAGAGPGQLGGRLFPGLGGFWAWWRCGLLAWLPRGWRTWLDGTQERLLFAREADCLRIALQRDGDLLELAQVPLLAGDTRLDRLLAGRATALPRWGLLPASAGLERRIRLPAAAASRLQPVLGFEIDRYTPFAPEDVHFDARPLGAAGEDQIEVALAVVPRRHVAALRDGLHGLGFVLDGIDLADPAGQPRGYNLLPVAERSRRAPPMRGWNLALGAVALLAIAAAGARIIDNRQAALDAAQARGDRQLAQASAVAAQRSRLAARVEGARFLDQVRAARPTTLEVWNEVTARLPEGTWLESFSIQGDQLLLAGQSDDAPLLVERMEGSPLWRKPALTGALRPDAGSGRNRFSLSAQLVAAAPAPMEAADGQARPR
jgi:general secretion pathway protein L